MEDVKLPTTVEEFQQARRDAYVQGAIEQIRAPKGEVVGYEARQRAKRHYPIRRCVPRVIRLSDGTEVKVIGDIVWSRRPDYAQWKKNAVAQPENIRALADLLANPFDEVDE